MMAKTVNLTGNRIIHQFRGKVSNIYIIEDYVEGNTFLVDCGMPSDTDNLIRFLHDFSSLKYIVCTHFHVDHVSGWMGLKQVFTDCIILFHEAARPFVVGDERIPFPSYVDYKSIIIPCMKAAGYFPGLIDLFNGGLYGTPFIKGFPLDRTAYFTSDQSVLPGFTTIHTPGHRPDSVSFFDPDSGILICGDFMLVINRKLIFNTFAANQEDQENSIRKIKQLKGLKYIFPGHGDCVSFTRDQV